MTVNQELPADASSPADSLEQQPVERDGPGVERTRRRILEAAAQCFARDGFARARIGDVAEGAGVSRALVYRYFAGKEELLLRVREYLLREWSASVLALLGEQRPASEILSEWVRNNLTDPRRRTLLQAVAAEDSMTVLAGWEDEIRRTRADWCERLAALLERGVRDGEFRRDLDVDATAEALRALQMGMMTDLYGAAGIGSLRVSPERFVDAAVELLLAGLRRGSDDDGER